MIVGSLLKGKEEGIHFQKSLKNSEITDSPSGICPNMRGTCSLAFVFFPTFSPAICSYLESSGQLLCILFCTG